MILWLAILLGLIQALTEFLPVSSSGHLLLARAMLDFDIVDGLTFDVAVHVGTLLAIVVYFRSDIARLFSGLAGNFTRGRAADRRLFWLVVVACIPAALAGFFLEEFIEIYLRQSWVVVITLVVGGMYFLWVERLGKRTRKLDDMSAGDAVVIGIAQTLALIPGVSRSGITIATGMVAGIRREEAARFSFVMASPLLAGAGLKKGLDLVGQPLAAGEVGVVVAGVVTSAVAGWLVIRFLLSFLRDHGLQGFAYYRFALAAAVAVYLAVSR